MQQGNVPPAVYMVNVLPPLLEGLVYGHNIAREVTFLIDDYSIMEHIPEWDTLGTTEPKEMVLIT
jgi:L-aspartate oxidase